MRDDELVASARAGDTAAFATLAERHRNRLIALTARLVREEAEDLVQEALLRAFLGLSQLRDPSRFGAWLCGIAVNLAKMRIRRRALELRSAVAQPVAHPVTDLELLELVRDALAVLPAAQRDAVLLHYVDDLSCEEIASIVGSTPGTVRVRLHRARQQLREELVALAPKPRPKEEIQMIEMTLEDIVVRVGADDPTELVTPHRIVLLREVGGERLLPIWVGTPEGDALAIHLAAWEPPRPMTSDLMAELIRAMGARVERVAVVSLREHTFYAVIVVAVDGRVEELDARPSDALNLAARTGAPIFAAADVLEQTGAATPDAATFLDAEMGKREAELPPGTWRSLSGELLASLYKAP